MDDSARHRRLRNHLRLAVLSVLLLGGCRDKEPLAPEPSSVIRGYPEEPAGCIPDVTVEYTDTTETIFTTFTTAKTEGCYPNLAKWGIDMADPMGVDTPQGNSRFQVYANLDAANHPSPLHLASLWGSPPQGFIEFDPPVRSVQFYYSRRLQQSAVWWGSIVWADSMRVRALERIPGTTSYYTHDTKVLYSNVHSTTGTYTAWDSVRLEAAGDLIQWMWFDGTLLIDNLKAVRAPRDTTFHITSLVCLPSPVTRATEVSCDATWSPEDIPATEILFDWTFQGDPVRVFPDASAQPFDPPPPINESSVGLSSWAGLAVLGGTVSLRATWKGDLDAATTQLAVSDRSSNSWGDLRSVFDTVARYLSTDTTTVLANQPPPPNAFDRGIVGLNVDSVTLNPTISSLIKGLPATAAVPSGPNTGLGYISGIGDVRSTRVVQLRTWISGHEAPKFLYNRLPGRLLTNRGLLEAMRRTAKGTQSKFGADSSAMIRGVWAHETYGTGGGRGHQGQHEVAAKSLPTCGKVPAILERVVGDDEQVASFRTGYVLEEGKKSLAAASDHTRVHSNFSYAPYYEVVAGQTTVDHNYSWKSEDGDPPGSGDPVTDPAPHWKCTRDY